MISATITDTVVPNLAPSLALSILPAPRFWLTNVVIAIAKLVIGKNANPSTLEYAPAPAIAYSPKLLILD